MLSGPVGHAVQGGTTGVMVAALSFSCLHPTTPPPLTPPPPPRSPHTQTGEGDAAYFQDKIKAFLNSLAVPNPLAELLAPLCDIAASGLAKGSDGAVSGVKCPSANAVGTAVPSLCCRWVLAPCPVPAAGTRPSACASLTRTWSPSCSSTG
jgi:hypothetical protein